MTRGQWTLIGLLLVQAMLIAVLRHPELKAAPGSATGSLFAGFDPAAVDTIQVGTKPEETLVLERDGSAWKITSADGYPADSSKVDDLLETIRKATARSAVVTSDKYHESLEVTEEKAQARIRLFSSGAEAPSVDLLLGKATAGGAHVRIAGEESVYEIRDLTAWQLRPDTASWMQRTLVDVPTDSVQRVAVKNAHGSFELEKVEGDWLVVLPEESKGRTCAKDKVDPIVRAAAALSATGAAGRLDPTAQGLGDDATTVTLTHDEGRVTVRAGSPVPDKNGQVHVTRDGFGFAATQWESSLASVTAAKLDDLVP